MKSIKTLQKEYRLTKMEILEAYDDAVRYFLCDEELEPFFIRILEKKIAMRISRK